MPILILILIIGISYAPFLLQNVHIWNANGLFAVMAILTMFGVSLFDKNKPLGCFFIWLSGLTLFLNYEVLQRSQMNSMHYSGLTLFNVLAVFMLYKFIVKYLNREWIVRILKLMRWVIISYLLLATLQYFRLDQFFKLYTPDNLFHNNPVVGFIGNGTHLSGFLACSIPLFWQKKRESVLAIILIFTLFAFMGMDKRDPSLSGIIIAVGVITYLLYYTKRSLFYLILISGILIGTVVILHNPEILKLRFFSFSGRTGIWREYWQYFKQYPITGAGLGTVDFIRKQTSHPKAAHLHLEYFQLLFETGFIGLGLGLWVVVEFFRTHIQDKLEITLKALVVGFLVSCCFNFPAHLWIPSTWAMFAYASVFALKRS